MDCYLGIDLGSVSTDLALLDSDYNLREKIYLRTAGDPINVIKKGISDLKNKINSDFEIKGIGTTGSGRKLAGVIVGADLIKNEITAHAVAAAFKMPEVRTVFEIGGQDSKIIIIRNGVAIDFAMNTVCAAGTGSFLDQQASRLGIAIEDFGKKALKADQPVEIAGRCSVFAESDMIHKQQLGYSQENILAGLCNALVRNYMNNLARGKKLAAPYVFQGGVAANQGIRKSFQEEVGEEVFVPENYDVMGAIGAAILAANSVNDNNLTTKFKGFSMLDVDYKSAGFNCDACANNCEIINIFADGDLMARWGGKCSRWQF